MSSAMQPDANEHEAAPSTMADIQPHDTRPRSRSVLSYESKRSKQSSSDTRKKDLTESPKDKRRLHTKADPSLAMNEAQPAAVAIEQPTSLESVSSMEWRDLQGNLITDPDRTNPSRNRLERPLDTIRGFGAAEERTWQNRNRDSRPASVYGGGGASTRNSYYGGAQPNYGRPLTGYYGSGQPRGYGRVDNNAGDLHARDRQHSYPPRAQRQRATPTSNMQPEHVYPFRTNQPSHDTLATGGASSRTGTTGNSTNPSSQNSSVDRFLGNQQVPVAGAPPVEYEHPRGIIKLDSNSSAAPSTITPPAAPKRQSWFKRHMSFGRGI